MVPLVSVVIASYEPGPYLRAALASVCDQDFSSWEAVVVDDGSTEDLGWVGEFHPKVQLLRQEHKGVSAARNLGVSETDGRYVAFLDQDDVWKRSKLLSQVEMLEADPGLDLVYTGFEIVDSRGDFLRPGYAAEVDYLHVLAGELGILLSSATVRRTALWDVGLFS